MKVYVSLVSFCIVESHRADAMPVRKLSEGKLQTYINEMKALLQFVHNFSPTILFIHGCSTTLFHCCAPFTCKYIHLPVCRVRNDYQVGDSFAADATVCVCL